MKKISQQMGLNDPFSQSSKEEKLKQQNLENENSDHNRKKNMGEIAKKSLQQDRGEYIDFEESKD